MIRSCLFGRQRVLLGLIGLLIPGCLLLLLMCEAGCSKKPKPATDVTAETGDTGDARGLPQEGVSPEGAEAQRRDFPGEFGEEAARFVVIYFDFDDASLRPDAREALRRNGETLLAHTDLRVTLEGHCDERGTIEYNQALGQRRANSAYNYLVHMGIDSARLAKVSYGEERPVDTRHNEAAWVKNRRVEFVIR